MKLFTRFIGALRFNKLRDYKYIFYSAMPYPIVKTQLRLQIFSSM